MRIKHSHWPKLIDSWLMISNLWRSVIVKILENEIKYMKDMYVVAFLSSLKQKTLFLVLIHL